MHPTVGRLIIDYAGTPDAGGSLTENAQRRVLLIEDHTSLRRLITIHLRRAGCEVTEVATVRGAAEILDEHEFDLIIADVHLPDGDSIAVLHDSHVRQPDLPIIYITGDNDRDLAEKVFAEDPAGFLVKPFEFSQLVEVVLEALARPYGAASRGRDIAQPIPVLLRPAYTDHPRRMPWAMILKIGIFVIIMLAVAFMIGHGLEG